MKNLFKKFKKKKQNNSIESKSFILIEQLTNGQLKTTIPENMTNQELLDITTKYYNQVVNPIYIEVQYQKREEQKAMQLVNGLVNNVEGIIFSKND